MRQNKATNRQTNNKVFMNIYDIYKHLVNPRISPLIIQNPLAVAEAKHPKWEGTNKQKRKFIEFF